MLYSQPRPSTADAGATPSPPPAYVQRGDAVEARYKTYKDRLQRFYDTLCARVKVEAPDLYPKLAHAPPKPAVYGYGLLPKLLPLPTPGPTPAQRPRARSAWYTWPWTEQKIDTEIKKLDGLTTDLERIPTLPANERRSLCEKLVNEYPRLPEAQRNIDDHVQYNRLWQPAIAGDRAGYDRGTHLHDAVLERQAIIDALDATDDAAFRKALDTIQNVDRTRSRAQLEPDLRAREVALANEIHAVIDQIKPPDFLRVERRSPHLWVVHVPVYTDIDDAAFRSGFQEAVESVWHVRDGDDEFRLELSITYISPEALYRKRTGCETGAEDQCRPPKKGDHIDLAAHAGLFPPNGARLTTGAGITHVINAAIVLGPSDAGPHLLAHEFGHMLGFRDEYFRGYHDLGPDGFQVMEVVAEPDDVMGNPGGGPARRQQFEKLIASALRTPRAPTAGGR